MPTWLQTVLNLAPIIVTAAVPGVGPILGPIIGTAITEAEKLPGASGQEKLQHALNLTNIGVAATNAIKPGTLDVNAVNAVAANAINTTVAVANLIHKPIQ